MVSALSWKAKLGLGVAALLAIGLAIFGILRWYDNQLDAAFDRGEASAYAKVEKRTIELAGKITVSANKLKEKANAKVAVVDHVVERVLVRGPGKAACPAVIGASSGGHLEATPPAGDAVAGVHNREGAGFIALPFPVAVSIIADHDKCLIEAQAWRDAKVARDAILAEENK